MKRLIFQLTVLILSIPCAASNYRGMFEIGGGPMFANERIRTSTGEFRNKQTSSGGLFSTAHGCQFTSCLFAGAGFGINCEWLKSQKTETDGSEIFRTSKNHLISIPLFLDVRWDLDVNRKITPYADLRLGYQLGMEGFAIYKARSVSNPSYIAAGTMKSTDGLYVQASAGVRWKVGKNTGVNLGVSFIPFMRREILIGGQCFGNRSLLLINVGIDIQGK